MLPWFLVFGMIQLGSNLVRLIILTVIFNHGFGLPTNGLSIDSIV